MALLIASIAPLRNRVSGAMRPAIVQVDQSLKHYFPTLAIIEALWKANKPEPKLAPSRACSQADAFTSC